MKYNIAMCLGRNIRLYRQKRGLSQRALAELAGISPDYVSMLEKGEIPFGRCITPSSEYV